jgi:alkylated DNA repair protein (DNA oxidative demethylase)
MIVRHNDFELHREALGPAAQRDLVTAVWGALEAAPLYRPVTPSGRPMSVLQTSLGALGWITDAKGYRYEPRHPQTGRPWPPIPEALLALWTRLVGEDPPDSCLVNLYRGPARMGLHKDADEKDLGVPVLGVSLGDDAVFRLGGALRGARSLSLPLASGDVTLLKGASRLAYHGIDRIRPGSSALLDGGGRLNLTLRRAG